jgi:hypothetical protein
MSLIRLFVVRVACMEGLLGAALGVFGGNEDADPGH